MTAAVAAAPPLPAAHPRRWLAAGVMMVAALMDMIDVTIVNVALPTIRTDLGASATQLEWVISAYMLAFASVLIVAGSFGDVFGRRRVFLLGIGAFGAASLCAGIAQTPTELIAARVVQGAAAGAMMPQLLATFRSIFPGEERAKAFGLFGAVLGFASAIGLVLGGVLTDADLFGWSWRSVFFINVPVALYSLAATRRVVPETRNPDAGRPDLVGAGLLVASIVAVTYALLDGRSQGWPAWIFVLLAAGVASFTSLGVVEMRRHRPGVAPLLRMRLFRVPAFSAGLGVQLAFSLGLQGFSLIFALWVQTGQHYSPLRAGVTLLAFSVGSFMLAGPSVPLAQRFGRWVLVSGALLMAAGIGLVDAGAHHVGDGVNPWPLVPGLVVAGAGLALLVIPLVNVVLAAVPTEAAGGASGLFSTSQQLGGALGVAVLGTIFFGRLPESSFQDAFFHTVPYAVAAFLVCALLALVLPRTAVADADAIE
jgi:EmrB/QacA subfamily drug resistance transporter